MNARAALRALAAGTLLAGVCAAAPAAAADVAIAVRSENPASGVDVYTCCAQLCVQIMRPTPFDILCAEGAELTLSAAPQAAGNDFAEWRMDGAPLGGGSLIVVTADGPHTLTAVYGPPPPPPAPDFIVTGIALTPASPTAGYTFGAQVTVRNVGAGAGDAGELCLVLDAAGDLPCGCPGSWARQQLGALAPGASRTVAFAALSAGAAGAKTLRAFADAQCGTAEAGEGNNQLGEAYTVATRTVQELRVATLDGRPVPMSHMADLEGIASGTTPFTRRFEQYAVFTLVAPALSPDGGAFQRWVEDGYPLSTERSLLVALPSDRALTAVYVGPGAPDFAVTAVELTPASPEPGGVFSAAVTVANRGTGAGVPRILDVFLHRPSPTACGSWGGRERVFPAMAPGETVTYTYTDLPAGASGAKVFRAVIDNTCLTDEPDEADNQGTAAYRVNAAPRLGALSDLAGAEGEELVLAVAASDADGEAVTLEAENLPPGATFDGGSGVFRWTPAFDQAGRHEGIRFVARDPWGAEDEAQIAIDVAAPAGPVFADDFADAGAGGDADWTVLAGAWRGGGGTYRAAAGRRFNLAGVSALDPGALPIGAGVLRAKVRLAAEAASVFGPNASLVFARQDADRFRWVRVTRTKVQIGQAGAFGGVSGGIAASAPRAHAPGRWYRYRVEIRPDGCVAAYRGSEGAPVVSHCFAAPDGTPSLVPGGVGVAASRAEASFDDVAVWEESALAPP